MKISSTEKAVVCRYASVNGVAKPCRHFKEKNLKENTVRDWLKIYKQALNTKLMMAKEGEAIIVKEIPTKKCGRPPLIREKLDKILENLVASLRSRGSPVGSHVVVGLARGVLLKYDRTSPCTMSGHFLPVQLIYQGTTPKCHPNSVTFPDDWHITHTANHWANEQTTIEYIEKIILPYVTQKRKDLNLYDSHSALVIFDVFKGQCTDNVFKLLEEIIFRL